MDIRIELDGTTPLLMHNPRMVDPQYAINREIKSITSHGVSCLDEIANRALVAA